MPLFIVRHASAGVRDHSDPGDDQRPLDAVGFQQAEAIAQHLANFAIDGIYSSFAVRCQQTVHPLADRLAMPVELTTSLTEGATPASSIGFVRSFTGQSVVLCSHGDVIPDVLRALEIGGTRLEGRGCAKGSVWQLDNSTSRIEGGTYIGVLDATPAD